MHLWDASVCVMLQVPAAEGLTVRVVNNINKKMEVKPRFLENFRNEGFADSFPYKQKVPHPSPATLKHNRSLTLSHLRCYTVV